MRRSFRATLARPYGILVFRLARRRALSILRYIRGLDELAKLAGLLTLTGALASIFFARSQWGGTFPVVVFAALPALLGFLVFYALGLMLPGLHPRPVRRVDVVLQPALMMACIWTVIGVGEGFREPVVRIGSEVRYDRVWMVSPFVPAILGIWTVLVFLRWARAGRLP